MKFTKKQTALLAVALLVVVGLLGGIYLLTAPTTQMGPKTITVETLWDDTKNTHVIETDQPFLGQALRMGGFVQGEESSMGLYILAVDGRAADESKQEWWCITKGGEALSTGADATPIVDGDRFELTLKTGY